MKMLRNIVIVSMEKLMLIEKSSIDLIAKLTKYRNKMEENVKQAIENYQCPGCIKGHNIECFEPHHSGLGCGKHKAGTILLSLGPIFLGMPKGFNRLGEQTTLKPYIYNTFSEVEGWKLGEKFNIPVWKHLTKEGHTLIRGIMPRINNGFILIIFEDCVDRVECIEITEKDIQEMD